ncbi:hypothetical protein Y136_03215 [Listeria monocytogenes]|nr:hypothetical protein [Listeria monocytogenes]
MFSFSIFLSLFSYHFWQNQYFALLTAIPFSSIGLSLISSLGVGLISGGLLFLGAFPLFKRFLIMQRVCDMIYSSGFYVVNDFQTPNMMKNKKVMMKKSIMYFPRFYVRIKGKSIEITVRLDGSEFHQSGRFKELGSVLEEKFSIDLVGMELRNSYFTYSFERDNIKNRLMISDIVPVDYSIELMKGIVWNIAKVPHALIVGGTGGGKSYFIQILLRAFAKMGADIRIGDAKFSDLLDMKQFFPHVYGEPDEISTMVKATVKEMNDRYKYLKTLDNYKSGKDFTYYKLKPIILVLDEYVAWISGYTAKKDRDQILSDLRQIILKGRQVGVIGIFATQRPDAEFLKGDIRDQLGLRVTLGEMSPDGYKMAFGNIAQDLINKKIIGRGYIYMTGRFMVRELFSPLVPEEYDFVEEMAKLLGADLDDLKRSEKIDSESTAEPSEPLGDYEVREIIYEEKDGYERSE